MSMPIRSRRDTETIFVHATTPQVVGPGAYEIPLQRAARKFRDESKIFICAEKRGFQRENRQVDIGPGSYDVEISSLKKPVSTKADYDLNIPRFKTPASFPNENPGPGQYEVNTVKARVSTLDCYPAWSNKHTPVSLALLGVERTTPSIPQVQQRPESRGSSNSHEDENINNRKGVDFARGSKRPDMFKGETTPGPCAYHQDGLRKSYGISKKGTSSFASNTPKQALSTSQQSHTKNHTKQTVDKSKEESMHKPKSVKRLFHRQPTSTKGKTHADGKRPITATPGPGQYGRTRRDWLSLYHIKQARNVQSARAQSVRFTVLSKAPRKLKLSRHSPGPADYFTGISTANENVKSTSPTTAVFGTSSLRRSIFDVETVKQRVSHRRFGPATRRKHPKIIKRTQPSSMFASKTIRFREMEQQENAKESDDERLITDENEDRRKAREMKGALATAPRFDHSSPFYDKHSANLPGPGDYSPEKTKKLVREYMAEPDGRFGTGNRFGGPDNIYLQQHDTYAAPGSYNISRSLLKPSKNVTMQCIEEDVSWDMISLKKDIKQL